MCKKVQMIVLMEREKERPFDEQNLIMVKRWVCSGMFRFELQAIIKFLQKITLVVNLKL